MSNRHDSRKLTPDTTGAGHARASVPQQPSDQQAKQGSSFSNMRIISVDEQERAFRSAQRHTRRVAWLKWFLPLIALGIIGGFTTWAVNQKPPPLPEEVASNEEAFQQDEVIMQNPNLNGFSDGRAYEVMADRAIQKLAEPDVVHLESLSARITLEEDQWVAFTSKTGRFNQKEEFLQLDGAVDVKSSEGYDLTTEVVEVKMKENYLQTKTPVRIASKDVVLEADKVEAIDSGNLIRFTGSVRLRIDASALENGAGSETTEARGQ